MKSSRRDFLVGAGVAAGFTAGMGLALPLVVFGASSASLEAIDPSVEIGAFADEPSGKAVDPDAALKKLMEGNARFVKGQVKAGGRRPEDFKLLAKAQYPEAIIVSCSDSRVAPEILFDTGVGDIFVIRVAGNIIAPSLVGSIEFAAGTFGTGLVLVMALVVIGTAIYVCSENSY